MNRRNVLKGLTAASAGSMALAFGSGAFTRVEANRQFDVGLAADDTSSQLVIEENGDLPGAVNPTDDTTFEFVAGNVQPSSISTFGTFDTITDPQSLSIPAFVIRNENDTGESVDVTLSIDTASERNTVVSLAASPSSESTTQSTAVTATSGATTGDITIEGVPSFENSDTSISDAEVDCGLVIDTTPDGVDTSSDLDLSFNVLAERSETT